ncbi:DUF3422 domain-containing protein [Methylobrevis pamukkalensis]
MRARVIGEVHARPFRLIETPRVVLHYAFMTPPAAVAADRAFLTEFCRAHGEPGPDSDASLHQIRVAGGTLRWERHSEFTTYTFDAPPDPGARPFASLGRDPFGLGFRPPGEMLVATRLDLVAESAVPETAGGPLAFFEEVWVSASTVVDGTALIVTDFRADGDGRTRILIVDRGLHARQSGALVQRLLEIETYRTFAMLGLPEAQRLGPLVADIEQRLLENTEALRTSHGLSRNRELLGELTRLSAELEALAAATAFRFGASRAYDEIVRLRLDAIREETYEGYSTWGAFLTRRTAPAMRTLRAIQDRQGDLAIRLGRAGDLLRTRIDVELEEQNRDLLDSMNRRARLQLRLQQTVEGLSVAAVSYYIVGLVGYLAKGGKLFHLEVDPGILTAAAVPLVIAFVWWTVRRIRKHHDE